jgi:AcrR family transcriptional regulator
MHTLATSEPPPIWMPVNRRPRPTGPPRNARERRARETRALIITAARRQVADAGYASASIARVARRAGIATGTIYRHFPSKGELFTQVFVEASDHELEVVWLAMQSQRRTSSERLAAGIETFTRRAMAAPVLAWALMAEPVDPAVERARLHNKLEFRRHFTDLLDQGVEAGELPAQDTPRVAAAIVGALQEAVISPLALPVSERSPKGDPTVDALVRFCLNAVSHP